jgi:hypothetical protein
MTATSKINFIFLPLILLHAYSYSLLIIALIMLIMCTLLLKFHLQESKSVLTDSLIYEKGNHLIDGYDTIDKRKKAL